MHARFEVKDPPPNCNNNDETLVSNRQRGEKNTIRTNDQWKQLLGNIYSFLSSDKAWGGKASVRSYCVNVLKKESQHRRISDAWKELGLETDIQNGVMPDDPRIKSKLEQKCPNIPRESISLQSANATGTGGRDLRPTSSSYFDEQEEAHMCEAVAAFARAGHPLEKANLKDFADAFLAVDSSANGTKPTGGISMDTVERIYKNSKIAAKGNVNPIDPKRAAQADPQALNAFYHQVDAWVRMAHEINPQVWPADKFANVFATLIYNTDEQGPNSTKLRNSVLIPNDMVLNRNRLFQNTREGDGKMQFHYTVANFVRADGVQIHPDQSIEGAPAPYILISDASSATNLDTMDKAERDRLLANQSESDMVQLNPAALEGWFNEFVVGNKDDVVNPFGFQVRCAPTGSMLKRTFFDFMTHFMKQLPHNQGPNGLGVYLFLDWHSSRECPQTLITSFFTRNILIFVLPSKTSIWSQPCDNGKNMLTAKDIAHEAHNQGLMAGKSMDYLDANRVFRQGLESNCKQQNDELLRTGTNAVVSSFKRTGLHPMDYNNEGWKVAIQNFGKLNRLLKQQREEEGEIIPIVTWIPKPKAVDEREESSAADEAAIKAFLPNDDFMCGEENEDGQRHSIDIPPLVLSMAIADCLVGKYVLDNNRDHNVPPTAEEDYEIAALKLIEFVAVTPEIKVDTTCTLSDEEIAKDKLITKLSATPFGFSITLRKKESPNRTLNIMKQNPKQFLVLDDMRRPSRNFKPMSFEEVIDQCIDANDDDEYTLTRNDKRKGQKKARIARKKCNETLYEDALEIANEHRLTRNVDTTTNNLMSKHPRFAARLATIPEEEELQMSDLYQEFADVVMQPHQEIVSVSNGDVTKDISITTVGSNVSAVSHSVETTLMKIMLEMKKAKTGGEKPRRKRRRGPGQSTHLGRSGVSVGILLQRQSKEEEIKALEKEEKTMQDELKKMIDNLGKAKQLTMSAPNHHWKVEGRDRVKGRNREVLARPFEVYKSSANADEESSALRRLDLTKAKVDARILELEKMIEDKRLTMGPIIAKRGEDEDFLACTAVHAPQDVAEVAAAAADSDDD